MSKTILGLICLFVVPAILYFESYQLFQIWVCYLIVVLLGFFGLFTVSGFDLEKFKARTTHNSSKLFWVGLPIAVVCYLIFIWLYQNISIG